jgi:hypothetical protein
MLIKFGFFFLFLFCSLCRADTWISLGGGSLHSCHSCDYNDFNPGLGIQKKVNTDLRLLGGVYYNSYHKVTVYAGAGYQPWQYGSVRLGILGAVVTNYDNLRVPIMALPALSIEGNRVGVDILGFPSVGSRTGLITVNLKYRL